MSPMLTEMFRNSNIPPLQATKRSIIIKWNRNLPLFGKKKSVKAMYQKFKEDESNYKAREEAEAREKMLKDIEDKKQKIQIEKLAREKEDRENHKGLNTDILQLQESWKRRWNVSKEFVRDNPRLNGVM